MKKQFVFTKESSFTHLKDKMHQSVTEHIVEDDQTKKLYHHVVSYGSWFQVGHEAVFMSHLLKKIGVTGFALAYSADDCEIRLPWYPSQEVEIKTIVQLPKSVKVEDLEFGDSKIKECEQFKQTFIAKTFKKRTIKTGCEGKIEAKELLRYLFSCSPFKFAEAKIKEEVYPLYCMLYGVSWHQTSDLIKLLDDTDILSEDVIKIMEKFIKLDIEKELETFEDEMGKGFVKLKQDLIRWSVRRKWVRSRA